MSILNKMKIEFEDRSSGIGYVRVENNEIEGYHEYMGNYSVRQAKDGCYHFSFEGLEYSIILKTANDLKNALDSVLFEFDLSVITSKKVRESEDILYFEDMLENIPDGDIQKKFDNYKFNDKEKKDILIHINKYILNPVIRKVFANREDFVRFWLNENDIYKEVKEIDRRVYLSNLEYGEFCFLTSGRIIMFAIREDSLFDNSY